MGRHGTKLLILAYAVIVLLCVWRLGDSGGLFFGRDPLRNLGKTIEEMSRPSFLDVWWGEPRLEYRSDDGELLRVEDRREVERNYLGALGRALLVTFEIATLGTFLAALLALPLGLLVAKNLHAPKPLAAFGKIILDTSRAIHTLVFGLFFVGIVGLGPVAGILAIAFHSMGTFGKLYAEAIESIDMGAIEAIRAVGASPLQVFFRGVIPSITPQMISTHLYVWEYNTRDSTILGLIGAGGLGLLISEAVSLFQWGRLATVLLVIIGFVTIFDFVSRQLRQRLL